MLQNPESETPGYRRSVPGQPRDVHWSDGSRTYAEHKDLVDRKHGMGPHSKYTKPAGLQALSDKELFDELSAARSAAGRPVFGPERPPAPLRDTSTLVSPATLQANAAKPRYTAEPPSALSPSNFRSPTSLRDTSTTLVGRTMQDAGPNVRIAGGGDPFRSGPSLPSGVQSPAFSDFSRMPARNNAKAQDVPPWMQLRSRIQKGDESRKQFNNDQLRRLRLSPTPAMDPIYEPTDLAYPSAGYPNGMGPSLDRSQERMFNPPQDPTRELRPTPPRIMDPVSVRDPKPFIQRLLEQKQQQLAASNPRWLRALSVAGNATDIAGSSARAVANAAVNFNTPAYETGGKPFDAQDIPGILESGDSDKTFFSGEKFGTDTLGIKNPSYATKAALRFGTNPLEIDGVLGLAGAARRGISRASKYFNPDVFGPPKSLFTPPQPTPNYLLPRQRAQFSSSDIQKVLGEPVIDPLRNSTGQFRPPIGGAQQPSTPNLPGVTFLPKPYVGDGTSTSYKSQWRDPKRWEDFPKDWRPWLSGSGVKGYLSDAEYAKLRPTLTSRREFSPDEIQDVLNPKPAATEYMPVQEYMAPDWVPNPEHSPKYLIQKQKDDAELLGKNAQREAELYSESQLVAAEAERKAKAVTAEPKTQMTLSPRFIENEANAAAAEQADAAAAEVAKRLRRRPRRPPDIGNRDIAKAAEEAEGLRLPIQSRPKNRKPKATKKPNGGGAAAARESIANPKAVETPVETPVETTKKRKPKAERKPNGGGAAAAARESIAAEPKTETPSELSALEARLKDLETTIAAEKESSAKATEAAKATGKSSVKTEAPSDTDTKGGSAATRKLRAETPLIEGGFEDKSATRGSERGRSSSQISGTFKPTAKKPASEPINPADDVVKDVVPPGKEASLQETLKGQREENIKRMIEKKNSGKEVPLTRKGRSKNSLRRYA